MEQRQPPPTNPETKPKELPKKDTAWHNAIASFMSRRIRHIHAKSSEWFQVHRSGGGSGGGDWNPWVKVIGFLLGCWLVYAVVSWVIELIQAVVNAIFNFLSAAIPVVAVILGVVFVVRLIGNK